MKEFLVPIRFERTVVVETTIKIRANNAEEATAVVKTQIDKGELHPLVKNIDNTDGVYEQFADHAETTITNGDGIKEIVINDETIEA